MKIAYLIMTHKNPIQLNRLINVLNYKNADFYVHIDKKSKVKFDLPKLRNIKIIKNNIPVFWGGFSQVEATLKLLAEAKKYNYDFYILLSGSDYPIKSNKYIFDYLSKSKEYEFINICKMPEQNKTFDRIEYFYLEGSINLAVNLFFKIINLFLRKLNIKRKYPDRYKYLTLYGGSTWWILSNNCINYILQFVKGNPEFVNFYKNTLCSDEMFFQTIVGNSKFKRKIKNAVTYADWTSKERPLPAKITEKHIPILSQKTIATSYGKSTILFARKFSDNSGDVVDLINKKLRI